MVDIDEEVIDISRRFLPSWHQGSFEDSRLELRFVDAIKYLEECVDKGEKFDVVILDLPEPIDEGRLFCYIPRNSIKLFEKHWPQMASSPSRPAPASGGIIDASPQS